jgi:hypothetical protein
MTFLFLGDLISLCFNQRLQNRKREAWLRYILCQHVCGVMGFIVRNWKQISCFRQSWDETKAPSLHSLTWSLPIGFLELLGHRLPASLDHMLAFMYLAYSTMGLFYETVPAFEDTWIECLRRYRMATKDDNIRDRKAWTEVARHWYLKAPDKALTTGRLYLHLAILARPNALQQLFYHAKSLCVVIPFTLARESILTLFDPVLNPEIH